METDEKQVKRNIVSIRKKKGLNQIDVANKMNICSKTYMNIENHPFRYDIDKLLELAYILDCNVDDFLITNKFTNCEHI